jgi:hypothetical protein
LFSATQEMVQAEQPMHLRRSIAIAQRRSAMGFLMARCTSPCMRRSRFWGPSPGTVGSAAGAAAAGVGPAAVAAVPAAIAAVDWRNPRRDKDGTAGLRSLSVAFMGPSLRSLA